MRNIAGLTSGLVVGVLGGLIGLGGSEFRLPLLVGIFGYRVLPAIVLNLAVSLTTVVFSFLFRLWVIPFEQIIDHGIIILNILLGSLVGSYAGVRLATRAPERLLYLAVVILLVGLSFILMTHDWLFSNHPLRISNAVQFILGLMAGVGIGIVSSMLGVAGGELIIPTIVLLYGVNIKLSGSLSLAISIPTVLLGLLHYYQNRNLTNLRKEIAFITWMSTGSIVGAFIGTYWLGFVSSAFLHVFLGMILLFSAWKMWRSHVTATSGKVVSPSSLRSGEST